MEGKRDRLVITKPTSLTPGAGLPFYGVMRSDIYLHQPE